MHPIARIVSGFASASAIIAGAIWFLITSKFKRRIQFDLDCGFYSLKDNPDIVIAEVRFIFENKGFVEHRLFNLNLSIHALESETVLSEKEKNKRGGV